ncbi:Multidrug resistance protein MdtL [Durusdinium trenchii]|eukprot:g16583.t1
MELETCLVEVPTFLQISSSLSPHVSPHASDAGQILDVRPSKAFKVLSQIALVQVIAALAIVLAGFAISGVPTSSRAKHSGDGISWPMKVVLAGTLLVDYTCTDQYQPSMPAMAREFGVSQTLMGSTIQLHVFSSSISLLFAGPISDRIGRRPVVLFLQVVLAISTFSCGCADSFKWFAAGRALQGVAASVGSVVLAVTQDAYDDSAQRMQTTSMLVSIIVLGPLVAPTVGGLLAAAFGWRFPFFALSFLAVVAFLTSLMVVEETAGPAQETAYLASAIRTLSDARRLRILACCAVGKSVFDIMTASNGFILEDSYQLPLARTAVIQSAMASSGLVGSTLASHLPWKPLDVMSFFSPILAFSAACMALVGLLFDQYLVLYMFIICANEVLIYPPLMSMTVEFGQDLRDIAGLASSVLTSGMNLFSLGLSLPAVAIATYGPAALLYVMAAIILTMPFIMVFGILPPSGPSDLKEEEFVHGNEEQANEELGEEKEKKTCG